MCAIEIGDIATLKVSFISSVRSALTYDDDSGVVSLNTGIRDRKSNRTAESFW